MHCDQDGVEARDVPGAVAPPSTNVTMCQRESLLERARGGAEEGTNLLGVRSMTTEGRASIFMGYDVLDLHLSPLN